jgi:hypothetical protein
MGPLSYLTAVDTSLEHDLSPVDHTNNLVAVSNDEVERVIRLWKESAGDKDNVNPYQELYKYLHPLVIGALDRASSLSLHALPRDPRLPHEGQAKAERISRQLNSSYPRTSTRSPAARRAGSASNVFDLDPSSTSCCRTEPRLLGDGPARDHRLRRAEPPRQRDHEHPRGQRPAGLLPGREGLALPQGRAALGAHERRVRLVSRRPEGGRITKSKFHIR